MTEATHEGASIEDRIVGILEAESATPVDNEAEPEKEPEASEEAEPTEVDEPETDDDEVELEPAQLAALLGLDENTLIADEDGVKFRAKVDGEEVPVRLQDLVKSYQLEGHVNKKSMELAEQRKAFDAERTQRQQELETRITQANSVLEQVESSLLDEFNKVNWDDLRATDPAEYAVRRQEYAERYQQVQHWKSNVISEAQRVQQERQQEYQANYQQMLQRERNALVEALPEWRDPEKAKTEREALKGYLSQSGFKDEEIGGLVDHRAVVLARKAMLYDQMQGKKPEMTKKVTKVPKVQKPGPAKTSKEVKAEQFKAKRAKLRTSNDTRDLAALLLDRI